MCSITLKINKERKKTTKLLNFCLTMSALLTAEMGRSKKLVAVMLTNCKH